MGSMVHDQRWSRALRLWGAVLAGLLLVPAAGALAACGASGEASSSSVYTQDDSGRTVTAAVGDTITIWLSENPSTGYEWAATSSDGLQPLESRYEGPSPSPASVGTSGKRVFAYEVTASGRQTVWATYERSWEIEPAGEFTLTIEAE